MFNPVSSSPADYQNPRDAKSFCKAAFAVGFGKGLEIRLQRIWFVLVLLERLIALTMVIQTPRTLPRSPGRHKSKLSHLNLWK